MKITRVEPILIAVPYEHGGPKPMRPSGPWTHMETLFVRIDTDAGITGWGEAFGFAVSALTREAVVRAVAPALYRPRIYRRALVHGRPATQAARDGPPRAGQLRARRHRYCAVGYCR